MTTIPYKSSKMITTTPNTQHRPPPTLSQKKPLLPNTPRILWARLPPHPQRLPGLNNVFFLEDPTDRGKRKVNGVGQDEEMKHTSFQKAGPVRLSWHCTTTSGLFGVVCRWEKRHFPFATGPHAPQCLPACPWVVSLPPPPLHPGVPQMSGILRYFLSLFSPGKAATGNCDLI